MREVVSGCWAVSLHSGGMLEVSGYWARNQLPWQGRSLQGQDDKAPRIRTSEARG